MTPRLVGALLRLAADLDALRLQWAMVGGLAVSARSEPRTTRDVDVTVAVSSDAEAEGVVNRLQNRGYRIHKVLERTDRNRMALVRLLPPGEREADEGFVLVDVMFNSSGIETDVTLDADRLDVFPGRDAPVAKTGHLLAMKTLAARQQDLADVQSLLAVADAREIQRCREAIDLIGRRGYDLGRDLLSEFEEHLRRFREARLRGGL